MLPRTTDFLVIGGGIVGVTVAAEIERCLGGAGGDSVNRAPGV